MSRKVWDEMGSERWVWSLQHPALRMTLVRVTPGLRTMLPRGVGVYVLMSVTLQILYAGKSEEVQSRVEDSAREQPFPISHVLVVTPLGVPWSDGQRDTLEAALIDCLPGCQNRQSGQHREALSEYLTGIVSHVQAVVSLLIFAPSGPGRSFPTQGAIVRELVFGERRHPFTVGGLIERLRELGWAIEGETPWRTLRRDLCDEGRGGSRRVRVTGPWSGLSDTYVHVQGYKYASGWRPSTPPSAVRP